MRFYVSVCPLIPGVQFHVMGSGVRFHVSVGLWVREVPGMRFHVSVGPLIPATLNGPFRNEYKLLDGSKQLVLKVILGKRSSETNGVQEKGKGMEALIDLIELNFKGTAMK